MLQTRDQFRDLLQLEKKYGGMGAAEIKRLKELEDENALVKRMYADQSVELQAAKDLIVNEGW